MKILIDAMGGDYAPLEIIRGTLRAKKEVDCSLTLVGDTEAVRRCAKDHRLPLDGVDILHASDMIGMADSPLSVRSKPDTSLRVGLSALARKEYDAFISAGNTGALQMGANLFVRRIPGLTRSAIGTMLPLSVPVLLLDSGANATFTPELLCQYALMGSIYMKKVHSIEKPRVGLLNIGSEDHKGTPDHLEAFKLLRNFSSVCFVGNVEPPSLTNGVCDVLVADGFSGNVLLKTMEAMSGYLFSCIDSALGVVRDEDESKLHDEQKKILRRYNAVRRRFDSTEYGGAPLIGISAPVIKAHGNSDANAIKNAIRQAMLYAGGNVVNEIAKGLEGFNFREKRV